MTTYQPSPNTVAHAVCQYFAANPDEELDVLDIATKFGCGQASVHTLLRQAVNAGTLQRRKSDLGDYLYLAGPNCAAAADAAPASKPASPAGSGKSGSGVNIDAVHKPQPQPQSQPQPQPKPQRGYTSNRVHIDIAKLQVEDNVPFVPPGGKGAMDKWAPLFDRLTKPGQSVAIPGTAKSALAAAAIKRNKLQPPRGKFAVQKTGPDTARVWRVA